MFNDTSTTEIYPLSLHDALPICLLARRVARGALGRDRPADIGTELGTRAGGFAGGADRKSTRLNSSHTVISYAVFCLKKKKNMHKIHALHEHQHQHQQKQAEYRS